jgi:hypothetical protein
VQKIACHLAALLLISAIPAAAHAATLITECGQEVVGDDAVLEADLDCSTHDGHALILERATLTMNGFTIRGNPDLIGPTGAGEGVSAVHCPYSCTIIGPGTVTGAAGGTASGQRCCVGEAISGDKVRASDITIEGNGGSGIGANLRLTLDRCIIRNNDGYGVLWGNRATIRDTVIENNGIAGAWNWGQLSLKLERSTVTGNQGQGVIAPGALKIVDSEITGNAINSAACEYDYSESLFNDNCVDLYVGKKLKTSELICGSSFSESTNAATGLCTND